MRIRDYGRSHIFPIVMCLLIVFMVGTGHSQGVVVMAKKIGGEIPLNPDDSAWKEASSLEISLAAQVMVTPRIDGVAVKNLSVKALHNSKEIAFLVEWPDQTEDSSVTVDQFSDAVALEFPSSASAGKPHFAMGDKDQSVNIWFWKAAWQKPADRERIYATVDDFLGGIQADNPISRTRASPVENIIAQGFGSTTDMEKPSGQTISGRGTWQSNRWKVVFKRVLKAQNPLTADFAEGGITPVAFAVWNGSEGHRGGRKLVSTWYYVGVGTEERKTIYLYPVIAFLAALGAEAGIILAVRKRRKR